MALNSGVVIEAITPMLYNIRLDDGREFEAILPLSTVQKQGFFFGSLPAGTAIKVKLMSPPKPHRIIDFTWSSDA